MEEIDITAEWKDNTDVLPTCKNSEHHSAIKESEEDISEFLLNKENKNQNIDLEEQTQKFPEYELEQSETFHEKVDISDKTNTKSQQLNFDSELLPSTSNEQILVKELLKKKNLLEEQKVRYKEELEKDKSESSTFTIEKSKALEYDALKTKLEATEKELAQAKADAFAWENELKVTIEKLTEENLSIRTNLTTRLETLTKQCQASNKDKESMVMKYAVAEKEVLVVKKQKENLEKKFKELERDKELLQGKVKAITAERARICNTLDNKIQELGLATRNIEKLKDELSAKDIKIKWGQTKLITEMETHKETQSKLDRALAKICNHEEEIQVTREEAEKTIRETREGENMRANILDKQLQETKALLILEKKKHDDINGLYKFLKTEHESLRSTHILLDTEANTLRVKVPKYEQEREENEKLFESLQSELKSVKQRVAELSQRLSNSAVYAEQLESEKVKAGFAEQQIKDLQSRLEEQSIELTKCREKEAELLRFTQKLTDKDVSLQSQLTASQGKVRLLEIEHGEMQSQVQSLHREVTKLTKQVDSLEDSKEAEEKRLSSLLHEKTDEASSLRTSVSDLMNEIQVQQKKHSNSLKDSNREIQKLRKKLDAIESYAPSKPVGSEGVESTLRNGETNWCQQEHLSQESRTSSNASLNTVDSTYTNGSSSHPSYKDPMAVITVTGNSPISDLPQQVLIDRIVKLQKDIVKKSEKLEFLEEHVAQLVSELKKKNRIIYHYIMKEETGALVDSKSDYAKAEIMKHGGIMASVYGSSPKDGSMTLDLSLEINRKLQAVLEDTLLKNITLKENLNTLGDEVAKLALENSNNSKKS